MALHKIGDRITVIYHATGKPVNGAVKKVIEEGHGNQESRYLVQFEGTNEEQIFKQSAMKWV